MNIISSSSISSKLVPLRDVGPRPHNNAFVGLAHFIAASVLGIFGILAVIFGSMTMYRISCTAPSGIIQVSVGLIMICIGLPPRVNDTMRVYGDWKQNLINNGKAIAAKAIAQKDKK
ncbi:MAG: hypothetical protein LLG04_13460 [Parachlamydia sp.]|nr:hypothetical protein [Parachlamydia sp.]